MPITISPLNGRIGAVIGGIDLAQGIAADDFNDLHQALLKHKVVFLRQQQIDDAQQEAFSRLFGEQVPHPTVPSHAGSNAVLNLDSRTSRANSWHTDVTFAVDYPKISILRGVVVPEAGGDTVWANTAAAYADLPPHLKTLAESLWARHSNLYDYASNENVDQAERRKYRAQFTAERYETLHPLVRVHPETGEKVLVLGHFLRQIEGLSSHDSALLFELFHGHVTRLENTVRWRWQQGDIAIWDNRATEHIAIDDYGIAERIMRRTTLSGEVPLSVDGKESIAISPSPESRSPKTEQDKLYLYRKVAS